MARFLRGCADHLVSGLGDTEGSICGYRDPRHFSPCVSAGTGTRAIFHHVFLRAQRPAPFLITMGVMCARCYGDTYVFHRRALDFRADSPISESSMEIEFLVCSRQLEEGEEPASRSKQASSS
jgi:hypothetical protein